MNLDNLESLVQEKVKSLDKTPLPDGSFDKEQVWERLDEKIRPKVKFFGLRLEQRKVAYLAACLIPLAFIFSLLFVESTSPSFYFSDWAHSATAKHALIQIPSKQPQLFISSGHKPSTQALLVAAVPHKTQSEAESSEFGYTAYANLELGTIKPRTKYLNLESQTAIYKPVYFNHNFLALPKQAQATGATVLNKGYFTANFLKRQSTTSKAEIGHFEQTFALALSQPSQISWAQWKQASSTNVKLHF